MMQGADGGEQPPSLASPLPGVPAGWAARSRHPWLPKTGKGDVWLGAAGDLRRVAPRSASPVGFIYFPTPSKYQWRINVSGESRPVPG